MTLAKKGRRSINVNNQDFHWTVTRQVHHPRGGPGSLTLTVVIQRGDGQGSKLLVGFVSQFIRVSPDKGFADDQSLTIKPDVVRRIVERALALGWKADSDDVALDRQELAFPEVVTPLAGDGTFDSSKLAAYLSKCTLIWKEP